MEKLKLQLQCAKSWSDMKPTESGGFCSVCNTQLIDFTSFTNQQITQYLELNNGKKICGRFSQSQLHSESPALFRPLAHFSLKSIAMGLAFTSFLSFEALAGSDDVLGGMLHPQNVNTMVINSQLKVVQSDGKTAVPLAKITLKSSNGIPLETVFSTLDGTFSFTNAEMGQVYTLVIETKGYKTKTLVYTFDREYPLKPIRLVKS